VNEVLQVSFSRSLFHKKFSNGGDLSQWGGVVFFFKIAEKTPGSKIFLVNYAATSKTVLEQI